MNITIMNRCDAIRYCHKEHDEKTIIISISDPYMVYKSEPHRGKNNGVMGILRLSFADADKVSEPDVYGHVTGESDMMSDDDAQKIVEFLKKYPDTDIIVHCDAGISRSSGVAAAIMKWATGDDSQIFKSYRYRPNTWCYRKTLDALTMQEGQI